jgi:hypothetical protein
VEQQHGYDHGYGNGYGAEDEIELGVEVEEWQILQLSQEVENHVNATSQNKVHLPPPPPPVALYPSLDAMLGPPSVTHRGAPVPATSQSQPQPQYHNGSNMNSQSQHTNSPSPGPSGQNNSQPRNNNTHTRTRARDVVPVGVLKAMYAEDFNECCLKRKTIVIHSLNTYQGYVPESTNGCTVIAPLLAIHHLQSDNHDNGSNDNHNGNGNGSGNNGDTTTLTASQIEQVMDQEACMILPKVRAELELTKDALIIPSDVHDHLITMGLLNQDQFVGVCGGNIMDDFHIMELLKMLNAKGDHKSHRGKKVAATLFFHEHVVTILNLQRAVGAGASGGGASGGGGGYDLIDSLPSRQTLYPNGNNINGNNDNVNTKKKKQKDKDTSSLAGGQCQSSQQPCHAVRIRCKDLEALQTLLKWYSISKFTPEDAEFIDALEWDDTDMSRAAFDPRIFQAFVWANQV